MATFKIFLIVWLTGDAVIFQYQEANHVLQLVCFSKGGNKWIEAFRCYDIMGFFLLLL